MDSQQQAAVNEDNNGGSGNNNSNRGSFICSSRQTSSRWTPTSEQIRILKELYYNTGLRSPNADQIQKISANLRQYGKIEGKNVFYWFQNHKARERQKKRFTTPAATATSDHLPMHRTNSFVPTNNKFSNNIAPGHGQGHGLSSASAGQMGNYGSYASAAMEKSFGDCSISASTVEQNNYGYVGIENYSPCYTNFFDKKRGVGKEQEYYYDQQQIEEEPRNGCQIRKTLELFPVHNIEDDMKTAGFCNFRPSNWFGSAADLDHGDGGSRASLELTLNSYASYSGSNDCL